MAFGGARRPEPRILSGRHATLVPLDAGGHARGLRAADRAGEESTWRWLPYGPFETDAAFVAHIAEIAATDDPLFFSAIVGGAPLGVASLMEVVPEHGRIEIGHVWFSAGLQRTTASVPADGGELRAWQPAPGVEDRRAQRPLALGGRAPGFSFEGVFRQHQWVKGKNRDTAWYSLIDSEWPAAREAIAAWLAPSNFDARGRQRAPLATKRG